MSLDMSLELKVSDLRDLKVSDLRCAGPLAYAVAAEVGTVQARAPSLTICLRGRRILCEAVTPPPTAKEP
jgi:hypothetical protein